MRKRIEEYLFYAFLILFPLQIRVILWQGSWAFGEWQSAALYGSDIVFILFTGLWFYGRPSVDFNKLPLKFLAAFLLLALLSVAWSTNPAVSAYQFLRLLQGVILFLYIKYYARHRFSPEISAVAFLAGGLLQSAVAMGQYFYQHDLGLRWLGETILSPRMTGVAVFHNFSGEKLMRAYGTLPHPNILAFYLITAAVVSWWLVFSSPRFRRFGYAAYAVILPAFWFSYSRTAYFVFVATAVTFTLFAWRDIRNRLYTRNLVIITFIIGTILLCFFWQDMAARILISSQEEAVQFRLFFNRQALSSGGLNINWLGVGWGSFVPWFIENRPGLPPYMYQPVHNIFLLTYAETGVIGLLLFAIFLISIIRQKIKAGSFDNRLVFLLAGALLFTGLFDHFPFTLQQGRILFWGILAIL